MGQLIADLISKKRQLSEILLDVSRHGAARLHLRGGMVLAGARLDKSVGLGVRASLKIRIALRGLLSLGSPTAVRVSVLVSVCAMHQITFRTCLATVVVR